MEDYSSTDFLQLSAIMPERLYFATLASDIPLKVRSNKDFHFFCIDDELAYENFFADFGPLNLSMLYRFCVKINRKLESASKQHKKIVHYCSNQPKKRVNAAFLMGAYQIIYLRRTSKEAFVPLQRTSHADYIPFRDAAMGPNTFPLTLSACLAGVEKAFKERFLEFETFNCDDYEHYERVENGDFNWIIPAKFLAFCGPHNKSRVDNGHPLHSPDKYFPYFRQHNVTTVIRLNKKMYDAEKFTQNGFEHHDLYFLDGSTPTDEIMKQFLQICEQARGAIAIHCKAGLGRTGTLIGCYMMKHYRFTAPETMAWVRICRPGSIIGVQQHWLQEKEAHLWLMGDIQRSQLRVVKPNHSSSTKMTNNNNDKKKVPNNKTVLLIGKASLSKLVKVDDIAADVESIKLDCSNNNTQGDDLNRIKAQRKGRRIKID